MPEPTVLLIVDEPGWAHDRKAHALARCLRGRFAVRIAYQGAVTRADVDAAARRLNELHRC